MLQSSSSTMVTPEGKHLGSPRGCVDVARGPWPGLSPRAGVVSPLPLPRQSLPSRGTRQGQGGRLVSRDQMAWNTLVLTCGVMVLEKGSMRTTLVQYLKGCGKLNGGP